MDSAGVGQTITMDGDINNPKEDVQNIADDSEQTLVHAKKNSGSNI